MAKRIVTLPGDGIGPEVTAAAVDVLNELRDDLDFEEHLIGGASIDAHGTPLTDDTLAACRAADAVFLGAVGGPKWDTTDPDQPRPEQGLLGLRRELDLYANLRPVRASTALLDASPLKREIIEGTDLVVFRELTGGIYFGEKTRTDDRATDLNVYTVAEIERIARTAFRTARSRVSSVDKANVLETSRLWRETVRRVHGDEFPNIELEHVLVDNAAMRLVAAPRHFDVILTDNMFGDILSDESAMLTGSIGMLPSASLGEPGTPGMFEPVHGSAPDIAGRGVANPLAMFLSGGMMLRHGFGLENEAAALESAVDRALEDGLRTHDLGGTATTADATGAVLAHLRYGARREPSRPHLDERGVRRLGGRQGPRPHARPALRHRGLRGHPLLRHGDRAGGVPPRRPRRPPVQVGRALLHADAIRPRPDPQGDARADLAQPHALLLHPADRLPRLRHDGPVPARRAGRRHDRGVGVGLLPRRRGQAERHPREGLLVAAHQPRLAHPARQGLRSVPELDPRQDRDPQGRLRGGDPPRRQGLRLRGLGREHLRRPRRAHRHAAADRVDPRRHQPQVDHPDRARPRLRGDRARHRPRRALPRRRGLRLRHRGRAHATA